MILLLLWHCSSFTISQLHNRISVDTFDETGDKVAFAQMSVFIVGAGGFGGPRNSSKAISTVEPPNRYESLILCFLVKLAISYK